MNLKQEDIGYIEALAENEKLINGLYSLFVEKFPQAKNFWTKISDDEIMHANWLYKLLSKVKKREFETEQKQISHRNNYFIW